MGLNDNFSQSRSQILLIVPSPSLKQAYNMIMQDESQRVQSSLISNCVFPLQKMDVTDPTSLASSHTKDSIILLDYIVIIVTYAITLEPIVID